MTGKGQASTPRHPDLRELPAEVFRLRGRSEKVVVCWDGVLTLHGAALLAIGAGVTVSLAVVVTIAHILHLPIAVTFGTPGSVSVATIVVALSTIILARREFATTATTRRAATRTLAARRTIPATATTLATLATLSTRAVAARIKAPRSRGWSTSPLLHVRSIKIAELELVYLNLQQVVATDALVVHLVVRIVSITAALILNESEPSAHC
jgi:hypothetical protein